MWDSNASIWLFIRDLSKVQSIINQLPFSMISVQNARRLNWQYCIYSLKSHVSSTKLKFSTCQSHGKGAKMRGQNIGRLPLIMEFPALGASADRFLAQARILLRILREHITDRLHRNHSIQCFIMSYDAANSKNCTIFSHDLLNKMPLDSSKWIIQISLYSLRFMAEKCLQSLLFRRRTIKIQRNLSTRMR